MIEVYTGETPPESYAKSMFLAGPSPRKPGDANWRTGAIRLLGELGYDGVVFAPTYRDQPKEDFDYEAQVAWERKWLNASDLVVFWVPRDLKELPGFTTNVEYGMWLRSGKILLGSPKDAEKMTYLNWWANEEGVERFDDLRDLLQRSIEKLPEGAVRTGGERDIPLHLWLKPEFQHWWGAQKGAGNRIEGAEVQWAFRVGEERVTILWSLFVKVWVAAENRTKDNEVVVFRPDSASIVAYCRPPLSTENDWLLDTEILQVREFRTPGATEDAMVHEAPGGSSWKEGADPEQTAREELLEETGLKLEPDRFVYLGYRQVAATLLGHRTHCFAVELTPDEMLSMKWQADKKTTFGKIEDTEITYLEVRTVREILASGDVDWNNLGMIFQTLAGGSNALDLG